jgi:hypothetical protein
VQLLARTQEARLDKSKENNKLHSYMHDISECDKQDIMNLESMVLLFET